MNKHKLKLLFALFSFLFGTIFVACNYDDSSREFHDEDGNKAHFKKEKVSFDVFSKNKKLFSKLITDEGILISKSANKIVSASDNSFFINTNSATYIENENGLHSYTFFINRNLENVLLENLVISLQEDGTYKSFIVTYNISQPELQNLKNGLFVDMDNRMNIEIFNDDNFMSQLSGKIVYSPCITGTTEYWKCSNGNQHSPGNPGPPVCVADSFEYVINVEYGLCASDDGEVIGEGDTGGSNGGGGGSSDSNDSTYDGSDTDIHGNGGVSTAPTLDEEEILEETPCETSKEDLKKVFPNMPDADAELLASIINTKGQDFGIDSDEDLWHFLSQAGHETGGFTTLSVTESTYWTTASKLSATYSRFTMDSILAATNENKYYAPDYIQNSSGVANVAMCCKFGNGDVASGDGYKYRGRGLFQLTWKDNYTAFKNWYNNKYDPDIDPVSNPGIIASNDTLAILSGLWYYKTRVDDKIAIDSTTTVDKVTIKINGKKKMGLSDRKQRFQKAKDSINCL